MAARMSQAEINRRAHALARRACGDDPYSKKLSWAFKEVLRQEREVIEAEEAEERKRGLAARRVGGLLGAAACCWATVVLNGALAVFAEVDTLPAYWVGIFVSAYFGLIVAEDLIDRRMGKRAADWLRKKLRR